MGATEASPLRRSGRKRKRNTKYSIDAFDGLDILSSADDQPVLHFSEPESEEFNIDEAVQVSDHDDQLSVEDASDRDAWSEEDDAQEDGLDVEPMLIPDDEISGRPTRPLFPKAARLSLRSKGKSFDDSSLAQPLHSRGIRFNPKHVARDVTLIHTFGGLEEDVIPLLKGKDKWFDEISLPARKPSSKGIGGLGHSFYVSDVTREREATEGWNWYYLDGAKAAFQKGESYHALTAEESQLYTDETSSEQNLLMGPFSQKSLFTLPANGVVPINDAWDNPEGANANGLTGGTGQNRRHGWILNAGGTVRCLDWSPNKASTRQYLAVSAHSRSKSSSETYPLVSHGSSTAPAFAPSSPCPSSIQIWEFAATTQAGGSAIFDMKIQPRLATVLCHEWGRVKQLKWCPSAMRNRISSSDEVHLGLLAILTGDGKIRVIDAKYIPSFNNATQHSKITRVAFESRPPETICTCITWLSPTLIGAGCANGYVAIWDLRKHLSASQPTGDALPAFYHSIHLTYIVSITACTPSRPHLLLTSSSDGHHRLTSLHSPTTDFVLSSRSRVNTSNIIWHDHTQHAFAADDTYTLRGYNVRNFFQSAMMTNQDASVLCLAASTVHPSLLMGCADGTAVVYNPLRRLLHKRTGGDHYRQIWFKHDWRRGRPYRPDQQDVPLPENLQQDPLATNTDDSPTTPQLDFLNGLSRITTGYRITALQDSVQGGRGYRKAAAARVAAGGIVFSTVYEEPTAMRALAWNPNLEVGGWAAAGLGCGLVVVEDLCWD